jgi:hypothetical protein
MRSMASEILQALCILALVALPLLVGQGCSSDSTGVDGRHDNCQEVGVLLICGADTTRVDTL